MKEAVCTEIRSEERTAGNLHPCSAINRGQSHAPFQNKHSAADCRMNANTHGSLKKYPYFPQACMSLQLIPEDGSILWQLHVHGGFKAFKTLLEHPDLLVLDLDDNLLLLHRLNKYGSQCPVI